MKKLLLLVLLVTSFIGYGQVVINQPTDYELCSDNDTAEFDLDIKTPEVLGGLSPVSHDVSYHLTQDDAFQRVNPLSSPYTNTANPEIIFVSVLEVSTGNIAVAAFDLVINSLPTYTWSFTMEQCDEGSGFATFDLTQLEQEFMNGNGNLLIYYHETYQDALANTNAIFNPLSYTNIVPNTQDIYIRVENPLTGCFFVNNTPGLILNVGPFDVANTPTPYEVCDDNDDGIVTFNLDNKTSEILGGNQNPTLTVTYHETLSDAEGFFNVLNPIYTNTIPFAQTVYVRVSQNTGDCYDITTLNLIVNTDCVSASSVLVEFCAEVNTPLEVDLTFEEPNIVNGQNTSDFIFTYYYSEADAQNENSPIANPEVFLTNDNTTIIYVRVEDAQSTNFTVIEYIIVLNFNPLIEFYGPFTICGGNDIVLYPFINNNNGAYEYLWSTGETNPEIIVNTGGVYTVTITDLISGCISTESVEVIEEDDAPVLADASDLTSCDSNTVFDLTLTLPEILNGQDPSSFIISFHNSFNDASSNDNPIIDVDNYIATNGIETIFVRVQNSVNACFSISDFTITTESLCVVDVDCAQPVTNTFCYTNGTVVMYQYTSVDGSPLQVFFTEGQVEVNYDELVVYDSDGFTNLNPTNIYGNNGDLAGLSFFSSGDSITVFVDSDGSVSCQDQGYTPISYEVSCADPNAVPDCNVILTQPLDGATDVDENTDLSWIAPSGVVTGYKISLGLTSGGTEVLDNEDVGNVLTYDMGILDFEVTYYVTITPYNTNGDADGCAETSFTTRTNPFQALVCEDGVVNTTYCYDNDDTSEFSFQSSDGLPLTIIFNAGTTETNFDEVYIVDSDGTILNPDLVYGNFGDFAGLTYTSTGDSLTVRFDSDFTISCGQGSGCCTTEFDFDVFCASTVGFIQVNAFVDDNANSMYDANEFSFSNGYFTYEINGDGMINTVNSSTGHFQIISGNETDVYDITFNLYDESEACYDITTSSFDNISVATGSTVTLDFPVVEEQSCEDLGVYLINYWAPRRPGFTHYNFLVLENHGFTNISSGTVEFTHDPLLVYNAVTSVNPNYTITNTTTGFTVDFVNLQPGDVEYIDISITCPVTVALDDIVTNTATYLTDTNDLVASNNYSTLSEVVVGSWDPNDKMESHGPKVLYDEFSTSDEWLYYTIRFQNLGTAEAIFVRIDDELDASLDETSFQMLRSSHDYVVTRTENSLEWFFEDINLPAEQDDAEGSNGFVYFRIKPQAGYGIGDIIPNTAAIYFDFNAPVITNRFETEFVEELLSVSEFDFNGFELYPNPANNLLNIKLNNITNAKLSIYDIQGKLVFKNSISEQELELNVSDLQSGLYFVKLNTDTKEFVKKLIIE